MNRYVTYRCAYSLYNEMKKKKMSAVVNVISNSVKSPFYNLLFIYIYIFTQGCANVCKCTHNSARVA